MLIMATDELRGGYILEGEDMLDNNTVVCLEEWPADARYWTKCIWKPEGTFLQETRGNIFTGNYFSHSGAYNPWRKPWRKVPN